MTAPLRLFLSYSHADDAHRVRLEKHLSQLARQGLIEAWSDRKILPGEEWSQGIDARIERADVIVFLVSADFLASEYISSVEVERALARRRRGETRVVPIIVKPCEWQAGPLGGLQALPPGGKAVTLWRPVDRAWAEVAARLRAWIEAGPPAPSAAGPRPAGPAPPDPTRYLEWVREECSWIELRGMGAQVAERLPLDRVYTRLRVGGPEAARLLGEGEGRPDRSAQPVRKGDDEGGLPHADRSLGLPAVLARTRRAVLVGDPGSGKTTFLRFAARVLAEASLEGSPGLAERSLGIDGAPPLPVFVRLAEVEDFLREHPDGGCPPEAPEHLLRYLDYRQRGSRWNLPDGYLRRQLAAAQTFLLLDGLDEVPGAARDRLAHLAEGLIRQAPAGLRVLVTCRTRAWEETQRLSGVPSFCLEPLGTAQVDEFVSSWSRALHHALDAEEGSPPWERAESYRRDLRAGIDSPHVGPLTESPLMLTMLAVVHWSRRRLPEQRSELYEVAVEYLLESREKQSPFSITQRREALQALALAMFEDPEGVQRLIGRREAAAAVAPLLALAPPAAADFLDEEALYSGLLVSRSAGELEFWHLSFQEFLAALVAPAKARRGAGGPPRGAAGRGRRCRRCSYRRCRRRMTSHGGSCRGSSGFPAATSSLSGTACRRRRSICASPSSRPPTPRRRTGRWRAPTGCLISCASCCVSPGRWPS